MKPKKKKLKWRKQTLAEAERMRASIERANHESRKALFERGYGDAPKAFESIERL